MLNTIVGPGAELWLPAAAPNIGRALASIANATGVLIGFETTMDASRVTRNNHFAESLRGLTLGQALDRVVALDSRYEWRERQGVIHVRPAVAFRDRGHFLNRRVPRFELMDAIPLHATFQVHRIYRSRCEIRHPIYTSAREAFLSSEPPALSVPVTVSLADVTVLDIMDAVIKAHGTLHWNVTYSLPPDTVQPNSANYEHAIFGFHDRPSTGGWWRMCVGDGDGLSTSGSAR